MKLRRFYRFDSSYLFKHRDTEEQSCTEKTKPHSVYLIFSVTLCYKKNYLSHRKNMQYKENWYNLIIERIIKCAIEVHKERGPGLMESGYEN